MNRMMQDAWHRAVRKTERPSEKSSILSVAQRASEKGKIHSPEEK